MLSVAAAFICVAAGFARLTAHAAALDEYVGRRCRAIKCQYFRYTPTRCMPLRAAYECREEEQMFRDTRGWQIALIISTE